MLMSCRRTASIKARSFCNMFVLGKDDVSRIVESDISIALKMKHALTRSMKVVLTSSHRLKFDDPSNPTANDGADGGGDECFTCGKRGHWAVNCPENPENKKKAAAAAKLAKAVADAQAADGSKGGEERSDMIEGPSEEQASHASEPRTPLDMSSTDGKLSGRTHSGSNVSSPAGSSGDDKASLNGVLSGASLGLEGESKASPSSPHPILIPAGIVAAAEERVERRASMSQEQHEKYLSGLQTALEKATALSSPRSQTSSNSDAMMDDIKRRISSAERTPPTQQRAFTFDNVGDDGCCRSCGQALRRGSVEESKGEAVPAGSASKAQLAPLAASTPSRAEFFRRQIEAAQTQEEEVEARVEHFVDFVNSTAAPNPGRRRHSISGLSGRATN